MRKFSYYRENFFDLFINLPNQIVPGMPAFRIATKRLSRSGIFED